MIRLASATSTCQRYISKAATAASPSRRAARPGLISRAPDGARVHIAGKTDRGFTVIEVWESPEHIDRFMESSGLGEAMQGAQVPEPEITEFEVHTFDWVN